MDDEATSERGASKMSGEQLFVIVFTVLFIAMITYTVIGLLSWVRRPRRSAPSSGQIVCPYCKFLVSQSVTYLGQSVACPKCHGQITAPGGKPVPYPIGRFIMALALLA